MTPETVINAVCDAYNAEYASEVTLDKVLSGARNKEIVDCRQIIGYILRDRFRMSYERAGKILGLNHATIIHAVRAVGDRVDTQPKYADVLMTAMEALEDGGTVMEGSPVERLSYERMRSLLRIERRVTDRLRADIIELKGKVANLTDKNTRLRDDLSRALIAGASVKGGYVRPSEWTPEQRAKLKELRQTHKL